MVPASVTWCILELAIHLMSKFAIVRSPYKQQQKMEKYSSYHILLVQLLASRLGVKIGFSFAMWKHALCWNCQSSFCWPKLLLSVWLACDSWLTMQFDRMSILFFLFIIVNYVYIINWYLKRRLVFSHLVVELPTIHTWWQPSWRWVGLIVYSNSQTFWDNL